MHKISFFQSKLSRGLSLLEVIIAVFIITVGMVGIFSLITQTMTSARLPRQKLIASYLAQEGIEIVRNIRDTNWIEEEGWDHGISSSGVCIGTVNNCDASVGCIVGYNDSAEEDPVLLVYNDEYLNIDNDGFYSYDGGTPTNFQRKIVIEHTASNIFKICVLVKWKEKGKSYNFSIQGNLYNWRE